MDYDKPITKRQCERFSFMLRQKRKDNKLTLRELESKLGYPAVTISNWENLKTAPDLYNVEDVATYFNLPMNVFIGEG